ncbi:MAG TPA: hypothetical protein VF038_15885 [Usitatibacter sp.]
MILALAAVATVGALPAAHAADGGAKKERMVMQVSDADPARWNLALNNMKNVQSPLGAQNVDL